jgi:dTDP-4-dehydrorhamnose 3,5-epimerase
LTLGLSQPYDSADELGCHWRDPELGIEWPAIEPRLSARDAALPPLRALLPRIPAWAPA